MKKQVLILGAGLSGLSSAVHLVSNGFKVTILEKRHFAGGRTFSFSQKFWPYLIDNGPHVMLGCYKTMIELLKITGGEKDLKSQLKLTVPFYQPNQKVAVLKASPLPAPLDMLFGVLGFKLLKWQQKISVIRIFFHLDKLTESEDMDLLSATDWLTANHQDAGIIDLFWRPLILATLNANPDQVSFLQLFRILKIGFLSGKENSRMIFFPEGLTGTLINPALEWLKERGCKIEYRHKVESLHISNNRIKEVKTSRTSYDSFDCLICALPFGSLKELLIRSDLLVRSNLNRIKNFKSGAIINFHFWYQGKLMDEPFAAFQNLTHQWLFVNRTIKNTTHYTIVVSGAENLLSQSKQKIIETFFSDLKVTFPRFNPENVEHFSLATEKNATLICTPNVEKERPDTGPYLSNLFLAGDWTQTGLPPTMESAALSGKLAAGRIADI